MNKTRLIKLRFLTAALCCVSIFAADAIAKPDKDWKKEKHERHEIKKRGEKRESYFRRHGYTRLNIPPGHYPPPGECRIWHPDRPAGQQPKPFRCGAVPPRGAWVIHHPKQRPGHIYVSIYDPQHQNAIISAGEFENASGAFIGDIDLSKD